MATAFPEHALVLFDMHGELSVVRTQKLTPGTKIKIAGRPNLRLGTQPFLVEVLELSDDEALLKKTQENWTHTHRGIAVEKEMSHRQKTSPNKDGGFLDIWPSDEIINAPKKRKATNNTVETQKRAKKPTAKKTKTTDIPQPSTSELRVSPEKDFPYDLEIQSSANQKTNKGVQTDTVVIISTDTEAQLAEHNQSSLLSKRTTSTQTQLQDQTLHKKLDKIIKLLEEKQRPRPSIDFLSTILQEPVVQQTIPETIVTTDEPSDDLSELDRTQTTITNFYLPVPEVGTSTILTIPEPPVRLPTNSDARTFRPCFKGPIIEISSYIDVGVAAEEDHELRVSNNKMWKTQKESCSCSNFAWNLTKELYSLEELEGRNYHGRKGKTAISPRRKHAIEHAISDVYGPEMLSTCVKAINTGLRNVNRYKKPAFSFVV